MKFLMSSRKENSRKENQRKANHKTLQDCDCSAHIWAHNLGGLKYDLRCVWQSLHAC